MPLRKRKKIQKMLRKKPLTARLSNESKRTQNLKRAFLPVFYVGIKENIRQPKLPDVFRRGENSFVFIIGFNPTFSLTYVKLSVQKFLRHSLEQVRPFAKKYYIYLFLSHLTLKISRILSVKRTPSFWVLLLNSPHCKSSIAGLRLFLLLFETIANSHPVTNPSRAPFLGFSPTRLIAAPRL